MKMNKIVLAASLLVSAHAFAMETAAEPNLFSNAKQTVITYACKGAEKVNQLATFAWSKVPDMPNPVKNACNNVMAKGNQALEYVAANIPASVKEALANRNVKIATGAVIAVGTGAYLYKRFIAQVTSPVITENK